MQLDEQALGDFIDSHYRQAGDRLFRLEQLPNYLVDSDGDDWTRWLRGETEPTWSRKQPWLDVLAQDKKNGLVSMRVRRFDSELTDYELYECHMGYAYNVRYEDIRVLRDGEHQAPASLVDHDYWIIEPCDGRREVVRMFYDAQGRFIGASALPADQHELYVRDRDEAWLRAEPFGTWWAHHHEFHRREAA